MLFIIIVCIPYTLCPYIYSTFEYRYVIGYCCAECQINMNEHTYAQLAKYQLFHTEFRIYICIKYKCLVNWEQTRKLFVRLPLQCGAHFASIQNNNQKKKSNEKLAFYFRRANWLLLDGCTGTATFDAIVIDSFDCGIFCNIFFFVFFLFVPVLRLEFIILHVSQFTIRIILY